MDGQRHRVVDLCVAEVATTNNQKETAMADEHGGEQLYPKFRHHPTQESKLVKSEKQEDEETPASDGWVDLKRDAVETAAAMAKADADAAAGPAKIKGGKKPDA